MVTNIVGAFVYAFAIWSRLYCMSYILDIRDTVYKDLDRPTLVPSSDSIEIDYKGVSCLSWHARVV